MVVSNPIRFGQVVRRRRDELGLTQDDVAAAGGPSDTTLTRIEKGVGTSRKSTRNSLDKPLRWKPGSAARVWAGGDPIALDDSTAEDHSRRGPASAPVIGPDRVPVSLTVLTELLELNSRLRAYAAQNPDSGELADVSGELDVVVAAISGQWVTKALELNAGADRSASPTIEFAFAAHLTAPVSTDDPDASEKLYRRWLIGREDGLTEELLTEFRARVMRR